MMEQPSEHIRDTMGVLYDFTPLKYHLNSGTQRTWLWRSDDCVFMKIDSDATAIRKTKAHAANGEHLLCIQRYVSGGVRGRIGDLNIDRGPGSINILDQASLLESIQRPASTQLVFIHKSALGYDPDVHPPFLKIMTDTPFGRLLDSLFQDVFHDLTQNKAVDLAILDQFKACLKIGMGADPKQGDLRRHARDALRGMICTHIEQNLEDPDLSVDSLLKAFGVSRASLYRMFEDRGGVRQFIRNRRLLNAVLDISCGPVLRGDIATAAEKWGFSTSADFNRSIRREFGVAPGSLVNLPIHDRGLFHPEAKLISLNRNVRNSFTRLNRSRNVFAA